MCSGQRQHGQSKLGSLVVLEYAGLLIAKASGDLISTRFLAFGLVGSVGVVVHLSVLHALLPHGLPFAIAQTAAMFTAMAFNYTLNNTFTYRDQRRRGWRFLTGLGMFAALCGFGVMAGVGVSTLLYTSQSRWWVCRSCRRRRRRGVELHHQFGHHMASGLQHAKAGQSPGAEGARMFQINAAVTAWIDTWAGLAPTVDFCHDLGIEGRCAPSRAGRRLAVVGTPSRSVYMPRSGPLVGLSFLL